MYEKDTGLSSLPGALEAGQSLEKLVGAKGADGTGVKGTAARRAESSEA